MFTDGWCKFHRFNALKIKRLFLKMHPNQTITRSDAPIVCYQGKSPVYARKYPRQFLADEGIVYGDT